MTPFPDSSRYARCETARLIASSGKEIVYLLQRETPQPERFQTIGYFRMTKGDRLDHVATRFLQDPERFWLLCDANRALNPEDLEKDQTVIRITLPEGIDVPPDV